MAATITEIAKDVGVSVAVVSRLLRGDPALRISDARRQQILETVNRLGGAKGLRQKRMLTQVILIPVNKAFTPDWLQRNLSQTEMYRTFEATLAKEDFQIHFSFFDPDTMMKYFEEILGDERKSDGILLVSSVVDEALAKMIRAYNFPHVTLDRRDERWGLNTVVDHAYEGTRQAFEHLRELGHRRIGYLGPTDGPRYSLMVAATTALDMPFAEEDHCFVEQISPAKDVIEWRKHACTAFRAWLDRKPQTTALMASSDLMALGAIDAMRERGLTPGRDISLVGFDNIEQRDDDYTGEPFLTTIDNPRNVVGRRAGELLINQILRDQMQIVHERIPTKLIVRQTTGPAPSNQK